jgi:hypothetical protein
MENKRGGHGRGQGRKPIKQGEETKTISLRMTLSQKEKLHRLGGGKWVREKIDAENSPTGSGLMDLENYSQQTA